MSRPNLLVDARNVLYRAVYAGLHDKRDHIKYHHFVLFLRQVVSWVRRYDPIGVHIFWDAPRETVWRRKVLKTYKDRSGSQYVEDISEELAITTKVAKAMFAHMNIRQYSRKEMEADDLIYAAVTLLHPSPSVIVSTDSDMLQIPFVFNSNIVFDPAKKEEIPVPITNPVMQKALTGDKADSIDGYHGIGPVKSAALLTDPLALEAFLQIKGRQLFYRNLLLIDLSCNPRLLPNKTYVHRRLCEEVAFSKDDINSLMYSFRVVGLMQEFTDLVLPFKKLV